MNYPTLVEMLQAGAHFGHQVSRWHPKMKPFIFSQRNGVHIIDLRQTLEQMQQVLPEIKKMAETGKIILFVSTKPQAREIVKQAAVDCGMPYLVDRWLGGALTNFDEIKKLIRKYVTLKEKQAKGEFDQYTKKEQLEIKRNLEKMGSYLEGLSSLTSMPDAVFMPSVQREKTALVEARKTDVPVIGICDTNANPDKVDYVICSNDDAVKSIEMMVRLVSGAIKEGRAEWEKKNQAQAKIGVVSEKAPESETKTESL